MNINAQEISIGEINFLMKKTNQQHIDLVTKITKTPDCGMFSKIVLSEMINLKMLAKLNGLNQSYQRLINDTLQSWSLSIPEITYNLIHYGVCPYKIEIVDRKFVLLIPKPGTFDLYHYTHPTHGTNRTKLFFKRPIIKKNDSRLIVPLRYRNPNYLHEEKPFSDEAKAYANFIKLKIGSYTIEEFVKNTDMSVRENSKGFEDPDVYYIYDSMGGPSQDGSLRSDTFNCQDYYGLLSSMIINQVKLMKSSTKEAIIISRDEEVNTNVGDLINDLDVFVEQVKVSNIDEINQRTMKLINNINETNNSNQFDEKVDLNIYGEKTKAEKIRIIDLPPGKKANYISNQNQAQSTIDMDLFNRTLITIGNNYGIPSHKIVSQKHLVPKDEIQRHALIKERIKRNISEGLVPGLFLCWLPMMLLHYIHTTEEEIDLSTINKNKKGKEGNDDLKWDKKYLLTTHSNNSYQDFISTLDMNGIFVAITFFDNSTLDREILEEKHKSGDIDDKRHHQALLDLHEDSPILFKALNKSKILPINLDEAKKRLEVFDSYLSYVNQGIFTIDILPKLAKNLLGIQPKYINQSYKRDISNVQETDDIETKSPKRQKDNVTNSPLFKEKNDTDIEIQNKDGSKENNNMSDKIEQEDTKKEQDDEKSEDIEIEISEKTDK